MDTIHIDNCPVCSGKDIHHRLDCRDSLTTGELFSICSCAACGFAFTQDFPSEKYIGKYYEAQEYVSHTDTRKGLVNKLYHFARKRALKSKAKLLERYVKTQQGKLMDIGCGTGYFLNEMRRCHWVVTGIEKSEPTRRYAHKNFGLDIQDADYLFEMPSKTKDVVTMWHVLEHVEELNLTMQHLRRVLKSDGTLFIALPNKDSFDACHYCENWAAYDVPRHLWHFSPKDFCTFAEKHCFEVIKQQTMRFDPFYISMLSEKNKKTPLAPIVGFIKGSFFWFRSLFNPERASSIVYILKKK